MTDDRALACVKEANGIVRVEMEALLSMELANSPMWGADIRVSSGNFVTAKPVGVVDGVDFQHTGEVRKIDAEGIRRRLDDHEVVLISPDRLLAHRRRLQLHARGRGHRRPRSR